VKYKTDHVVEMLTCSCKSTMPTSNIQSHYLYHPCKICSYQLLPINT